MALGLPLDEAYYLIALRILPDGPRSGAIGGNQPPRRKPARDTTHAYRGRLDAFVVPRRWISHCSQSFMLQILYEPLASQLSNMVNFFMR